MIFILTGPVNSGKTTFLKRIVEELKSQKFTIDGFLSEAILQNQEKTGYDLLELRSGKSIPLIRKSGRQEWQKVGPFFFIPEGLSWAKEIILRSREAEILVVDEIGPLELSGKGFWPVLEKVIFHRVQKFLFVLRRSALEDFLRSVAKIKVKIFDLEEEEVFSRLIEEIKKPAGC